MSAGRDPPRPSAGAPLSPGSSDSEDDEALWRLAEEVIAGEGPESLAGDPGAASSTTSEAHAESPARSSVGLDEHRYWHSGGPGCQELLAASSDTTRPPPMPDSSVLQHNLALSLGGGGMDALHTVISLLDNVGSNVDHWRVLQCSLSRHYRRSLCDVSRTAAFAEAAATAALSGGEGAQLLFLGVGSFVPALHAASIAGEGKSITVLEPCATLRRICDALLRANGLDGRLSVCATAGHQPLTSPEAYATLGSGTYTVVCEAIGEGLVTEHLCEMLGAARTALNNHALGRSLAAVEPSHARLVAAPLQLRTEDVEGFDLSAFDALRRSQPGSVPSSGHLGPGWVPVRLDEQPLASVRLLAPPEALWELSFVPGPGWRGQPPTAAEAVWSVTKAGHLCGFACWFQLRVGQKELSSGPRHVGPEDVAAAQEELDSQIAREGQGAKLQTAPFAHGWKQAVHYLGSEWLVAAGSEVRASLVCSLGPVPTMRFELVGLKSSRLAQPLPESLVSLAEHLPPGAALPVQSYHFTMLADTRRNAAFCAAVQFVVESLAKHLGRAVRVLDLGCGAGLLGLAAARAGACVWAVEMNPLLRAVAAECALRNAAQLRGSLEVLPPAVSTQLRVGRDLPHRVDLVVSEVLDSELVTEGVLASLRHAKAELLMEQGVFLPRAVTVLVAPVECFPVKSASSDFDMSALDAFCCAGCYQPLRFENVPHRLLGPPVPALELDFLKHIPRAGPWATLRKRLDLCCELAGTMSGLAWWFEVALAGAEVGQEMTLSSGPGGGQRTWKQNCRFWLKAEQVQPGQILHVVCRVTESAVFFELEEPDS